MLKPLKIFKGDGERGLGLVHACKIVESWGGRLIVSSELGMGTTVDIKIPRFESMKFKNERVPLGSSAPTGGV